jgi:hypothetical protein
MIPLAEMVSLVIYVVIIALVFWAVLWFIGYVGIPEPFNKVAKVIVGVVALLVVVNLLLTMAGHPLIGIK